jgi:RNase H-fold protein (predicted Holliday junction resolvase)
LPRILNIQLKKLEFQDESLTSVQAENLLKSYKKPYSKGDIDMNAAAIILSDYLEENF